MKPLSEMDRSELEARARLLEEQVEQLLDTVNVLMLELISGGRIKHQGPDRVLYDPGKFRDLR